jgi:hypothetical protein
MNRSILIVICDFLLVSLVMFTTVDVNNVATEGARTVKPETPTNRLDNAKPILDTAMRQALEAERRTRDRLQTELLVTRDNLARERSLQGERDQRVRKAEEELAALEKRLQASQQELNARDKKVQDFQQALTERERLEAQLAEQRAALQEQLASAQANITNLNQQLRETSNQSVISGERLAAFEDLLSKQTLQSSNLQQQLTALAKTNEVVVAEKERLGTQLAVAETEKRFAAQQVGHMQDEVKIEREEKARLAEGVKELAARSGDLVREVQAGHPMVPNSIFYEFATNRIQARFSAVRSLLFGETTKNRETATILVTDGSAIYAVCHVHDTPLTLWEPGTDWEGLTGTLIRNNASCPIRSICFCLADPRVVLVPLNSEEAARLGGRVYRVSTEPYKFQDAVLVGTHEDYYGECRFQIDLSTPDYVKLDRSFLRGLIGRFNPSRGDLVFSKTGEMLGVMANSSYCLMMRSFSPEATLQFGDDVRAQHTGATLSALYSHLLTMPFKLQ